MSRIDAPLIAAGDLMTAIGLLTRLPVSPALATTGRSAAQAAWAFPLAGLATGLIAGLAGVAGEILGLGSSTVAGLVLAAGVLATGALHEDGLADTADGLWGGANRTQRLEIMKDSRIGAFGVIALILTLGLRWSALSAIIAGGSLMAPVLVAAVLSRAPMVVLMWALPHARKSGLSRAVGRPSRDTALLAAGAAAVIGLVLAGAMLLPAVLALALLTAGIGALARDRIGGQTGDILGATQQLCEVATLLTLSAGFG